MQEIHQTNESWISEQGDRASALFKNLSNMKARATDQTIVPPETIKYKVCSRNRFIRASWKPLQLQAEFLLIPTVIATATTVLHNHSHFVVANSLSQQIQFFFLHCHKWCIHVQLWSENKDFSLKLPCLCHADSFSSSPSFSFKKVWFQTSHVYVSQTGLELTTHLSCLLRY